MNIVLKGKNFTKHGIKVLKHDFIKLSIHEVIWCAYSVQCGAKRDKRLLKFVYYVKVFEVTYEDENG